MFYVFCCILAAILDAILDIIIMLFHLNYNWYVLLQKPCRSTKKNHNMPFATSFIFSIVYWRPFCTPSWTSLQYWFTETTNDTFCFQNHVLHHKNQYNMLSASGFMFPIVNWRPFWTPFWTPLMCWFTESTNSIFSFHNQVPHRKNYTVCRLEHVLYLLLYVGGHFGRHFGRRSYAGWLKF